MSRIPPIRREIVVDTTPDIAFKVFTERIGHWWPVAEHSVFGKEASVKFDEDEIVEVSSTGARVVWGSVTEWRPGELLSFTWHPGRGADRSSEVTVTFTAVDSQTLVTLVHQRWEVFADPAAARAEYDEGWPMVLERFTAALAQAAADHSDSDGATWVALMHTPGPTAPIDGSLFAAPQFAEHLAFLARMRHKGYLVAAGPLPDTAGAGMAILRLPGDGRLDEATTLATQDDASVASGFFTVDVRPWRVVLERER